MGGDSPSESEDAARRHAGQTTSEDHQVSTAAQVGTAEHPEPSRTANTQKHGETNNPAHRLDPPPPLPDFLYRPKPLQLSSVNSFLESINDYLKLKDEELALSISAQRVDGYEVEGINEEIDKVTRFSFSSCVCWCSS